ncbi:hypothetical protein HanRHA438_Chr17g0837481 [Helianthus annuus]|nr:hypothetical protein HanHA300_Chr17g0673571 [Helianthus annuus]KAJ0449287.1 hypothetical protein HanHA89_Chr17g0726721 [Helianthus annuus]KAJ0828463.1 hypothetical protein HanRHA438_Chr17g0837481 [Helianthus annuus]
MFLSLVHHSKALPWKTPVALLVLRCSGHSLLMKVTSMLSNHSNIAVTTSLPMKGLGLQETKCLYLKLTGLGSIAFESTEEGGVLEP